MQENQHLEYKGTYIISDIPDKLEVLRDISSLANASGGYLIIGINDDGTGRASGYWPHTTADLERMKQSIQDICIGHIVERLIIQSEIKEPDGNPVLLIQVPDSTRKPHMVTIERRTDFWTRYGSGKREMSLDEIRKSFQQDQVLLGIDSISQKFDSLERSINNIVTRVHEPSVEAPSPPSEEGVQTQLAQPSGLVSRASSPTFVSAFTNGRELAQEMKTKMLSEIDVQPYLWLAATPENLESVTIDTSSEEIRLLLTHPPGSRLHGWNMELPTSTNTIPDGIERGPKDYEYIALYNNAYMEFWTPLGRHFCWRQSPEEYSNRPELYPYPVVEYPVSFLRLYEAIVERANIIGNIVIYLSYYNLRGYRLRPYSPRAAGYLFADATDLRPYEYDHLEVPPKVIARSSFNPDQLAFGMLTQVYSAFHHSSTAIPFYEDGLFDFPS
ncbi:helix-turn-helix domain-containing protein [Chloroflexota bacterium]